jgi:superfamily II DNA or RNA helicase/SAM-dependent methyltransferase
MKRYIQPFQYIGVREAYEAGRFMIADEMGMFKTSQAIFVNNKARNKKRNFPTLVVCPTSVKEHWAREVSEWGYPKGQDIEIVSAENYASIMNRRKKPDWTIMHYPLLSILDKEGIKYLEKARFGHIILDEAHNAKNPQAIRTQAVKSVTDGADYVTLLSGTPVPNTIEDIYMLMHILEPNNYPLTGKEKIDKEARRRFLALYYQHPQEFKELIHRRMISRKVEGFIEQNVPELKEKNVYVDMENDWLRIYDEILEQEMPTGRKIMQLEKVLMDTSLIDPASISCSSVMQPKYEAMDEIVDRETKGDGKVLIFTNLKTGVVDNLVERYAEYGAIAITGDIPTTGTSKREYLRQRFQQDPETKVLISTSAMHEGVDLSAANAVINLELPWTPAEYRQRIKRANRPGEVRREKTMVYNIIGKYPRRLRKSLDEARWDMLEAKSRVAEYLMSGIRISREELMELREPTKVPRIKYSITSDNQVIFIHYMGWRGIGTEGALRRMKINPKKTHDVAELYPNFNMARNAADLYIPVIKELDPPEPWLDLAGGPGMLGYYAEKPVYVLDIDEEMLEIGKKLNTGVEYVNASFSNVPYKERKFGLVVCSLAFQMSEPRKERSKVLQEMNRVLKNGGYGIITIPPDYLSPKDRRGFLGSLEKYGFEPLEKYHGVDLSPTKIEMHVFKKIRNAQNGTINLRWKGDKAVRR